jgi:hypothetical protein
MAEDMILDFSKNSDMAVMILRYFNVIGSDPGGRLGEAPRPELREQGRISGACFDAARGFIPGLQVKTIIKKKTITYNHILQHPLYDMVCVGERNGLQNIGRYLH